MITATLNSCCRPIPPQSRRAKTFDLWKDSTIERHGALRGRTKLKKFRIPAIVFGGGINGLGLVRNLGRSGVTTYCVVDRQDYVVYSRFCKKCFIVPHIEENKTVLMKFLAEFKKRLGDYAVLFPATDLFTVHLSELKETIESDYYMPLPSHEVVRVLLDKKEFYQSISEHNIPHPITYFPKSPEDTKTISEEVSYPIFVKPSMSQQFSSEFRKKGFIANSADELMKYYLLASKHEHDVIFQEIIPGLAAKNIYGIEGYFDKNFNPQALFAYCRLRGWPPVFGNTSLRESVSISKIVTPYVAARSYLQRLRFHGLMEAEWKRDPRDGVFKLLEINPRQSMQNTLPTKCGINLILTAYLDAIGEKVEYNEEYQKGIKWIDFMNDLRSSINTRVTIKEWVASLSNVKEYAFFAVDDAIPWIINVFHTIRVTPIQRHAS